MPVSEAQKKATKKYEQKVYAPIKIKPKKAETEKIRKHAGERGESITRFLVRAADTQIDIDNKNDK